MSDISDIEQAIDEAVIDGMAVRARFLKALEEPDRQALGDLADDRDMAELEALLRQSLPPSYATFLRKHGSWKMFDPDTDLLSARQVLAEAASSNLNDWRRIAQDTEGLSVDRWVLIGKSSSRACKYFLNPDIMDQFGEMQVVEHDKVLAEEYGSFLSCLRETNEQYRAGLADIESAEGFDFSGI